jgi:hypothetical protein
MAWATMRMRMHGTRQMAEWLGDIYLAFYKTIFITLTIDNTALHLEAA